MRLATRFTFEAAPAIAWEQTACLLCGGEQHSPLLDAPDTGTGLRFLIMRCDQCGLAFTNPRPSELCMHRFYQTDYRCHRAKLPTFKPDPLNRFLPVQGLARLLDFGCGAGDFLMRMHAQGWNVAGVDTSEAAARVARSRGLIVHVGTLPHADLTDASFEAVTLRQSLEHVHQPLEVLRTARRLLTNGGRLVVAVPNFDSLAARWFGTDWFALDLPRHLTHFTPMTLRAMLELAGFAKIEMHQATRAGWIRHSVRLAMSRGKGGLWLRMMKSRLGSKWAGRWARWRGAAETLIAVAV